MERSVVDVRPHASAARAPAGRAASLRCHWTAQLAVERHATTATGATPASSAAASTSPAARMAAEGAPVDMDKIAAIKSAIASGNYPVNPDAIAERMLELDLPAKD